MVLIISILLALFFAYFFRQSLIDSMSNIHTANEAQDYLKRDSVAITTIVDNYLFTTITAVPKEKSQEDDDQNDLEDDSDDNDDNDDSDDGDSGDSGDGGD